MTSSPAHLGEDSRAKLASQRQCLFTGLDYWTHQNCCKIHIQGRTEAKFTYSISYFVKSLPSLLRSLFHIFSGDSRGQRSRAYLMNLNTKPQP